MPADLGSPDDSQGLRNDITGVPHRRKTKCDGRCSIQRTDGPKRVGTVPENMQQDLRNLRQTNGGPVCDGGEHQTPDFLLQTIPPQGAPHRRHVLPMEQSGSLRLPAALHDRPGPEKDPPLQRKSHTDSPLLAPQTMVRGAPTTSNGHPSDPTGHAPSAVQRRGTLIHPDIKGLQLVAWKLSGLPFDRGAFRKRLPRSRPTPGGQQPLLLTIPDYASSGNGATTDRYCHPKPLWHRW
ncbi:hypothetical protein BSL78_21218 [Apostichopus japonicus]|uniref:Uncharacterized protein n=1 Tax=Stichopus japonicus TaxID=307972 RepID=A0A2G8K1P2_STIJA|nr:hypothetical protein BSL78_21218 [Apostichopus japonicus]